MLFRILAALICMAILASFAIDRQLAVDIWIYDSFNFVGLMLVFPLFAYAAIFGKMPELITSNMSDEFLDELNHAETLFTKFDRRSAAASIVFVTLIFYVVYKSGT